MNFLKEHIRASTKILGLILYLMTYPVQAKQVEITILCWEGYAKPYVDGFIKLMKDKYGIDINMNIQNVSDPDEFWKNARGNKVDIISPAHNILKSSRWPFIKSGTAISVNLENIPNYKHLLPFLQKNDFVTDEGKVYGVPYTMGPYGLAYNAAAVDEPNSWSVLWDKSTHKKYTISKDYPDANIYTAALVMGANYNQIYDINELWNVIGKEALEDRLTQLATGAYSLWEGTANPDEFGQIHYAATWGYAVAAANKKGANWKMAKPKEGATMWVDHWVLTAATEDDPLKKKLCEEWINYSLSAELQVGVIRNWGVSPVVNNINEHLSKDEIETFNVGKNDYWEALSLWQNQSKRTQNAYEQVWKNAMKSRQ